MSETNQKFENPKPPAYFYTLIGGGIGGLCGFFLAIILPAIFPPQEGDFSILVPLVLLAKYIFLGFLIGAIFGRLYFFRKEQKS